MIQRKKSSNTKYNGIFEWAIQKKSIYTTRDDYSAGGKVEIIIPKFSKAPLLLPQVIQVATDAFKSNSKVYINELDNSTSNKFKKAQDFLVSYKSALSKNLTHIYNDVRDKDENKVGMSEFASIFADYLISKISVSTLIAQLSFLKELVPNGIYLLCQSIG